MGDFSDRTFKPLAKESESKPSHNLSLLENLVAGGARAGSLYLTDKPVVSPEIPATFTVKPVEIGDIARRAQSLDSRLQRLIDDPNFARVEFRKNLVQDSKLIVENVGKAASHKEWAKELAALAKPTVQAEELGLVAAFKGPAFAQELKKEAALFNHEVRCLTGANKANAFGPNLIKAAIGSTVANALMDRYMFDTTPTSVRTAGIDVISGVLVMTSSLSPTAKLASMVGIHFGARLADMNDAGKSLVPPAKDVISDQLRRR